MEQDLTCPVCCRIFYIPVTLACGHTFCKPCITNSYSSSKSCPLCRSALNPITLAPSSTLQKLISKHFRSEFQQRLKEDHKSPPNCPNLPFVFLERMILFPGEFFTMIISIEKQKKLFLSLIGPQNKFGICSIYNKLKLFTMNAVRTIKLDENELIVTGVCLERLEPRYIRRILSPSYIVSVNEICEFEINDSSLYEVEARVMKDENGGDLDLEKRLGKFTEDCVGRMTEKERERMKYGMEENVKLSFYFLSLYRIPRYELAKAFLMKDETERLKVVERFLQHKVPCRFHLVYSNRYRLPFSYVISIIFLIFFYFLSNS